MNPGLIQSIGKKIGVSNILELLSERLSGSDLNSLLLEVFAKRVTAVTAAELLRHYEANPFVQPADVNMTALLEQEIAVLKFLQGRRFQPIELSPAAQLGSCSVVGTVDQKKIISASRNTEILADATNAIALHIAQLKRSAIPQTAADDGQYHFCTVHRHVRTVYPAAKGFTPHFKIGCMVSSGRDTGNYSFERTSLAEHIHALHDLLKGVYGVEKIWFKLQSRAGYNEQNPLIEKIYEHLCQQFPDLLFVRDTTPKENNYYKGVQFKMVIELNGKEWEIADGGFVDWTRQLLGNSKERLMISGFGLELLYKCLTGVI